MDMYVFAPVWYLDQNGYDKEHGRSHTPGVQNYSTSGFRSKSVSLDDNATVLETLLAVAPNAAQLTK